MHRIKACANTNTLMGTARTCFYVVASAEYSGYKACAVFLEETGWCYLLDTVEYKQSHHRGTLPNSIDVIMPSTTKKINTIRAQDRKINSTA